MDVPKNSLPSKNRKRIWNVLVLRGLALCYFFVNLVCAITLWIQHTGRRLGQTEMILDGAQRLREITVLEIRRVVLKYTRLNLVREYMGALLYTLEGLGRFAKKRNYVRKDQLAWLLQRAL